MLTRAYWYSLGCVLNEYLTSPHVPMHAATQVDAVWTPALRALRRQAFADIKCLDRRLQEYKGSEHIKGQLRYIQLTNPLSIQVSNSFYCIHALMFGSKDHQLLLPHISFSDQEWEQLCTIYIKELWNKECDQQASLAQITPLAQVFAAPFAKIRPLVGYVQSVLRTQGPEYTHALNPILGWYVP